MLKALILSVLDADSIGELAARMPTGRMPSRIRRLTRFESTNQTMVVQQQPQHGLDAEFLQFRQDSAEAFKRDRFVLGDHPYTATGPDRPQGESGFQQGQNEKPAPTVTKIDFPKSRSACLPPTRCENRPTFWYCAPAKALQDCEKE